MLVRLDFWPSNDLNGSSIGSITDEAAYFEGFGMQPRVRELGGATIVLSRGLEDAIDSGVMGSEVFYRINLPQVHATKYLWGSFINQREQTLVSLDEKGGEGFVIRGLGPKLYLDRAILWDEKFSASGNGLNLDLDNGVFHVHENLNVGEVMVALMAEDAGMDGFLEPMLPDLTLGFDGTNDSNGSPWTSNYNMGEDFDLPLGVSFLQHMWTIQEAQDADNPVEFIMDLGEIGSPTFILNARKNYGRDLTGTAFGAGVVLLREGVNLEGELRRGGVGRAPGRQAMGTALRKATHTLVKGATGAYGRARLSSFSSGEYAKAVGIDGPNWSSDVVLDRIGLRWLRHQQNADNEFELDIVPGFDEDAGHYMAGPADTDGHVWPGDTVTLKTGETVSSALEYEFAPQWVTGLDLVLRDAARDDTDDEAAKSWDLSLLLNVERGSDNPARNDGGGGGGGRRPGPNPKLCIATVPPGDETFVATRLYPDSGTPGISPAFSSIWDAAAGSGRRLLSTTPGGGTGTGAVTWAGTGVANNDVRILQFVWPLPSTGTLDGWFRAFAQVKSRSGVGINENLQSMIGQCEVKIVSSDGGTVRGVAYGGHSLTSPGTNLEWPPFTTDNEPASSRAMPPLSEWDDPALGVALTPVAWSAGDFLVIEVGVRNFGTSTTGAVFYSHYDAASDMPEMEEVTTILRTWFEFITIEAGAGEPGALGAGHVDLVGTSKRAKRCDAKDHVNREISPTPTDDEVHGYPAGTIWHVLDDVDAPTALIATYISLDDSTGAAVWVLYGPNTHTHDHGLGEHSDVDLDTTAPTDGQAVTWDDTSQLWVPGNPTASPPDAEDVPIADAGGYYTGTDVEAGLQEAGAAIADLQVMTLVVILDGGGSEITDNTEVDFGPFDFACEIEAVTLLADLSGAIVVDIWKDTYANFPPTDADSITASAEPEITASGVKSQDTTLTGWTTAIAVGDTLRFHVDSATTIERVTVALKLRRT